MATVVNSRDVLLLAASPRLLWTGVRGVYITNSTSSFKVTSAGVPSPTTITFAAVLNGVNGTVTWSVPFGSATLSPSGTNCVLSYSNMFSNNITVRATVIDGGISYSANVTVTKVIDGATGIKGDTGNAGATGADGDKSRIAYSLIDGFTLSSSPSSVTVAGDSKPSTGTWGETRAWTNSPSTASAGQSVFQTTGTYNPTTNQTTWVVPYLSNLKVGQLSAITADMGTITAGSLTANVTIVSNGNIKARGLNSNQSSIWGDNHVSGGIGVYGSCPSGIGMVAEGGNKGIWGTCSSGNAIEGQTSTGYGVYGFSESSGYGGYFGSVSGYALRADGKVLFEEFNDTALTVNQVSSSYLAGLFSNTSSGKTLLIAGLSYAAYSGSGQGKIYAVDGFTPFTASHNGLLPKGVQLEVGDIVCDVRPLVKLDVSNTTGEMRLSCFTNDKSAVGVFVSRENFNDDLVIPDDMRYGLKQDYDLISFNSGGEGQINVCGQNGNIEVGDLITTSDIVGKGCKQEDDIIRSYTVAKARESAIFNSRDEVKQIACIYLAG